MSKRYLIHTAAFNQGLIMRKLTGFGTPKGGADARRTVLSILRDIVRLLSGLSVRRESSLGAKNRP